MWVCKRLRQPVGLSRVRGPEGGAFAPPPGIAAALQVSAAAAASAVGKAAAAKLTAAAGVKAAVAAQKTAEEAKAQPAKPEQEAGASTTTMETGSPAADRTTAVEAYVKGPKGLKDTAGWARAKAQLETAEAELKALREEQKSSRHLAARM